MTFQIFRSKTTATNLLYIYNMYLKTYLVCFNTVHPKHKQTNGVRNCINKGMIHTAPAD